ncbi:hypothetical protein RI129_004021 [Pyrocoelia pectoralis]|uniref:Uncharacterized protein n=1 Tax=Pyrocoelia pectoralis TaxID=417401 RepID=A0AAN7VTA8_9COLE
MDIPPHVIDDGEEIVEQEEAETLKQTQDSVSDGTSCSFPRTPPCTPGTLSECNETDVKEQFPDNLTDDGFQLEIDISEPYEKRIRIIESPSEIRSDRWDDIKESEECILYSGVETFAGYFIDEVIDTSINRLIEARAQVGLQIIIEGATFENRSDTELDLPWPQIEKFTKEIGMDSIVEYIKTWEFKEEWLYCIDFLIAQSDQCSEYYIYEVKFSIPTRCYPIPQATASVFFTIEVSRIKPSCCPVDVSYVFEGSSLVQVPGKMPFEDNLLFDIIDAKLSLYKSLSFYFQKTPPTNPFNNQVVKEVDKHLEDLLIISKMEKEKNYYPNCDTTVWLRSCKKEIIKPLKGKVTGTIPFWINGVLFRNGPGLLEIGDCKIGHLFDGLALLHRFSIKNGAVTYQCRFLQSNTYKKNTKANRIVVTDFGTRSVPDPCQTIFKRISSTFKWENDVPDNAMISIYPFGDELYTFTETPFIHKINKKNLQTEERVDMKERMGVVSHSSHPHVTSNVSYMHCTILDKNDYSMFDQAQIVAGIPARWPLHPSYMHTFGITKNYFVIVEQPLSVAVPQMLMNKFMNKPFHGVMKWYENEQTQINVVSRKSGKIAYTFFSKSFFYLHIINQYESANHIVLDICSYKDPSMIDCMYIEAIRNVQNNPDYANMFRSRPIRFVLPLIDSYGELKMGQNLVKLRKTKAQAFLEKNRKIVVKPERLCALGCETPTINYRKHSVDTINKTTKTWCEKNCYPSEPIFVPTPNGQGEDDGVILSALIWGCNDTNRVGLIVLNAKTLQEIGRAEFHTSSPVPKCLHGWFLPNRKQL